jgi:hypothetical protein
MVSEQEFQKLKLKAKIESLQLNGNLVAVRYHFKFRVVLYTYNNFFVEVWRSLKFDEIYSIDVAPERSIKEAYLNVIDLKKLGLEI